VVSFADSSVLAFCKQFTIQIELRPASGAETQKWIVDKPQKRKE